MIIKMIGVSFIVSASGWLGLYKASQLSQRTNVIRQIRMDLEFLEKEIGFARNPLEQALSRTAYVSSEPTKGLFIKACRELRADPSTTAREAWSKGVAHLDASGILTEEDLNIINLIGERMGTSDVSDQIRMLRQAGAEMKVQEEKSRQREGSEKKLWSYGGFLLGLMISILMI